jgi:hypothetical protein
MVLDTCYLLPTVFFVIFWFRMYNVHTYGTWQVFCIENWITVQYVQKILFFIQGEIWNLDHLVTCGIPYANTYGIPGNLTAKNTAEFRGIPYVFQQILYSVGSQKRTSVDTLTHPLVFTMYIHLMMGSDWEWSANHAVKLPQKASAGKRSLSVI